MKLYQALNIIGFDVHERINTVVGLCIPGKNVPDLVAVIQKSVNSFLEHGISQDILPHGFVARIKYADTISKSSIKMVRSYIQHLKHFQRTLQSVQKGPVN